MTDVIRDILLIFAGAIGGACLTLFSLILVAVGSDDRS